MRPNAEQAYNYSDSWTVSIKHYLWRRWRNTGRWLEERETLNTFKANYNRSSMGGPSSWSVSCRKRESHTALEETNHATCWEAVPESKRPSVGASGPTVDHRPPDKKAPHKEPLSLELRHPSCSHECHHRVLGPIPNKALICLRFREKAKPLWGIFFPAAKWKTSETSQTTSGVPSPTHRLINYCTSQMLLQSIVSLKQSYLHFPAL